MALILEERVTNLEALMAQFIQENRQSQRRTDEEMAEMRQLWQHSKVATDQIITEIRADIVENRANSAAYQAKMDQTIVEIRTQTDTDRAKMEQKAKLSRRQYGEMLNRLGTLVEDLVAPSIPCIVRQVVKRDDEPIESAIRVKRYDSTGNEREFDAVATCGPYFLINETKIRLSSHYIDAFMKILPQVGQYFPEHADKQIIGLVSSFSVDEGVVRYAQRQGLGVLGFGDEVMTVLNSPDFQPKLWRSSSSSDE